MTGNWPDYHPEVKALMQHVSSQQDLPGVIDAVDLIDTVGLPVTLGCKYFRSFILAEHATELLNILWTELAWQQKPIRLFGKLVMQPRLISWHCDPGVKYSYSGLKLAPTAWHPQLSALRTRLQLELDKEFNSVLVNAYRDGQDSMGWHADDEPELGPEPVLTSISLGEERCFRWRENRSRQSRGMNLQHGSLLLLSGQFQHRYQHCIPKTNKSMGLRINLTFRHILQL